MTLKKTLILTISLAVLYIGGRWAHLQFTYAEIENLTTQYSDNLAATVNDIVKSAEYPGSRYHELVEYFKVFEYSETRAKVFVVSRIEPTDDKAGLPGDRAGIFYYLIFNNGMWVVDQSRLPQFVWSDLGNADGETWPPYR